MIMGASGQPAQLSFVQAKRDFVQRYLRELITACGWNVTKAALAAKIERSNFKRLLKQHGIARPRPEWNGLCPANQHGLDFEGQPCTLCGASAADKLRANAPRMEHVTRGDERRHVHFNPAGDDGKCHAASERADGECSWAHCPVPDGQTVCPRAVKERQQYNPQDES